MSRTVFAFAVLVAVSSTLQIREVQSEQLEIELENLLHQRPQLVKSICQGKCPVSFLHSEVGWACAAGILTTSWILVASLLVFIQGASRSFSCLHANDSS